MEYLLLEAACRALSSGHIEQGTKVILVHDLVGRNENLAPFLCAEAAVDGDMHPIGFFRVKIIQNNKVRQAMPYPVVEVFGSALVEPPAQ